MSPTTAFDVAANVRAEVARQQLRQRDVGECLSLDQRAVSRRMRGEVEFSASELRLLAQRLNVSVAVLLGEELSA